MIVYTSSSSDYSGNIIGLYNRDTQEKILIDPVKDLGINLSYQGDESIKYSAYYPGLTKDGRIFSIEELTFPDGKIERKIRVIRPKEKKQTVLKPLENKIVENCLDISSFFLKRWK